MNERTALEIADRLKEIYYGKTGNEAAAMLRQQYAKIGRLTAEREEHAAEIDRLKRERHLIYDLLARIHRDGGQYTAEHGVEKACEDAESQVTAWLDTISGVDALIEQARIADSEACARICEKSLSREEAAYLIRARLAT